MAEEWYYGGSMPTLADRAKQAGKDAGNGIWGALAFVRGVTEGTGRGAAGIVRAAGESASHAASAVTRSAVDAVNMSIHEARKSNNDATCQKAIERMSREPSKSNINQMDSSCGTNVGAQDCERIDHVANSTDGLEVKRWWGSVKDAGAQIRSTVPYRTCRAASRT
jgi:hypothetical protein